MVFYGVNDLASHYLCHPPYLASSPSASVQVRPLAVLAMCLIFVKLGAGS
jgi:hypothetical protein